MNSTQRIKEWIDIPFSAMHKDWDLSILSCIRQHYEGKIHPEYGGIQKITKIVEIIDNRIMFSSPLIKCFVEYEANVLNPQEGDVISSTVTRIMNLGIFVEYDNMIKVLIQPVHITGYKFSDERKRFESPGTGEGQNRGTISKGDYITFEIIKIQKTPAAIRCIAKLVERKGAEEKTEETGKTEKVGEEGDGIEDNPDEIEENSTELVLED